MTQASNTTYHHTTNKNKRMTQKELILDLFESHPGRTFSAYDIAHSVVELMGKKESVLKRLNDLVHIRRLAPTDETHTVDSSTYTRYRLLPYDPFAVPKLTANERWMRSIRQYVDDHTYEVIIQENKRLKEYGV